MVSDVPLSCINRAAVEYHIPAKLIISVLNTERGRIGLSHKNKNGSIDLGPMQINNAWVPLLKKTGITEYQVLYDPCLNVKIGTAILAKSIAESDKLLTGVGDYNSHTIVYNHAYTQRVRLLYTKLNQILLS
jgi:hypothetical protein